MTENRDWRGAATGGDRSHGVSSRGLATSQVPLVFPAVRSFLFTFHSSSSHSPPGTQVTPQIA
jgi:hypothetical protein